MFRTVNLINNDTLYTAGVVNLSHGPVVLTIPPTTVTYSILPLSVFGHVIPVSIPSQTPGHYALVLKGWRGTLPGRRHEGHRPLPGHILERPVRLLLLHRRGHDRAGVRIPRGGAPGFAGGIRGESGQRPGHHQAGRRIRLQLQGGAGYSGHAHTDAVPARDAAGRALPRPPSRCRRRTGSSQQRSTRTSRRPSRRRGAAIRCRWPGSTPPSARPTARSWRTTYAHRPHELGTFHQLRGLGHRSFLDRAAESEFCQICNNISRGRLLDGVHRRGRPDAERRPAHLPADLPGRRDPAGQAVLVGHRVRPAHPGTGAQPG